MPARLIDLEPVCCHHMGMNITSAQFVKGIVGPDEALEDGKPQVAFIGRSNVGKSSVINTLTKQKGLARASSFPGRTQEINLFLINETVYFVDLPGYGYAKASLAMRRRLQERINWYLFESPYLQKKVVLIIDANIGPRGADLEMLTALEEHKKEIVVVANKIDKIKKSHCQEQLQSIQKIIGAHTVIPYSAEKRIGVQELAAELLSPKALVEE